MGLAKLIGRWRSRKDRRQDLKDDQSAEVELVYTDSFGNRWYSFANPLQIPASRALAAQVAATRADMNLTREDLSEYIQEMKGFAESGQVVDLYYLLRVLEDRITWSCEEDSLLAMAEIYFLLNDEPQGKVKESIGKKKREIWAKDEDCRAFFLREAYYLISGYSELSLEAIPNYLRERRSILERGSIVMSKAKQSGQHVERSS